MKQGIVQKERIHLIDTVRGIIIIGVVGYHMLFDLVFLFHINFPYLFHPATNFIRDFGAGLLIFISGIASNLSHSNLKRGIQCLGIAMVFSLVTFFVMPEEFIFFGVLHFFGISMIAYHFYGRWIQKLPIWTAYLFFVLFLFLFSMNEGTFGFFGQAYFSLPQDFQGNVVLYCLGFPYIGRYSSDYFPLIPWILLFITGNILGRYFKEGRIPKFFYKDLCRPITYIGTKTIYIYALHQPIVYGVFSLIFYLVKQSS